MRGKVKKQRFFHEFVLLLLLSVAIGAIAIQSQGKFTGFAVLGEFTDQASCEGAGHYWYNSVCNDIPEPAPICDSSHLSLCVEANCTTVSGYWYNSVCNSAPASICDSSHLSLCVEANCTTVSGYWYNSVCNSAPASICDSSHLSLCVEANCTTVSGYWYNSVCNSEEETCTESWTCEDWGSCSSGTKTRTCTDANSCGTETSKPSLTHSCEEETSTTTTTEEATTTATDTTTITPIIESTPVITCTPNWKCGDWQECIEGIQTRVCLDDMSCNNQEGIPPTSQACVVEIKETCSDKIKNQDETNVDCGGVCKKCGFFTTLAGKVISGPVSKVKEVVSNKTTWIIMVSLLGSSVIVFFLVRFFRSHKIQISSKK